MILQQPGVALPPPYASLRSTREAHVRVEDLLILSPAGVMFKRAVDLVLGIVLLLMSLPAVLLAIAVVKLASPGPAFYRQWREGKRGRPISVLKIRTMVVDAEQRLQAYLNANPAYRSEWEQHMKLRHDPRVIPHVGDFLRRFSVDELPQLWNVVKGEMSLVGPRPFPEYHLACFPENFRALRRVVKPGVTGLWQVTTRSDGDLEAQAHADSFYIQQWSPRLEMRILLQTLSCVFTGKGAC